MVLYNADVDGFAASFFVYRYLLASNKIQTNQFQSRPVWNYEYDFQWIPQFVEQTKPDLVVCVDIPIIQEPNVLNAVQKKCRIVIYDHHVVPPNAEIPPDKTLFLNSRTLSGSNEDHPASAFSAAAANQIGSLSIRDLPILATGLRGDWALKKYPEFAEQLEKLLPGFITACNQYLYFWNEANFINLDEGTDIPGLVGLRGKNLDYGLVASEQNHVQGFT